jgi:hypothetical protein
VEYLPLVFLPVAFGVLWAGATWVSAQLTRLKDDCGTRTCGDVLVPFIDVCDRTLRRAPGSDCAHRDAAGPDAFSE